MPKCPVCEKKLGKSLPPFCSTCGWDTKNDLGLGTFLGEIPKTVIEEYKQRLSVARKNWKAREEGERERREMEKKLKMFESRLAEMERREKERNETQTCKEKKLSKDEPQEKEWIEPVTGMILVRVPAGKFMMGDTFGDGYDDEKPVHEVELDGFYIGKYPVTQGQWKKVMGNNPSFFKKGDDYPVERISWHDAAGFIEKLKEMNGGRYEFHLPSEAQWEYAARSGGKKERYAGGEDLEGVAWYDGNSGGSTHPVRKKRPNELGIYDMSGNVWEWCQDIYDGNAYKNHAEKNPIYASGGSDRVIRGGGWDRDPRYVRCASRYYYPPAYRYAGVGFRLARK